jgi:bifunctional non-homologous end joining protein LigD
MFSEEQKFYAIDRLKAKLFCPSAYVKPYNYRPDMNEPKKFVVQRHERQGEPMHWDLMLESRDILETYGVNRPPEEWGKEPIEAVKIFDHPLKFLTYEGSVNKGKGSVTIADAGTYRLLTQNENRLTLELSGTILKGEFIFVTGEHRARRG